MLAEHPDQRREVYQDRSLLNRAVDETLRFEPTGPHVARYTLREFEMYGTTVPAGSAILLLFGAANRDPRRYTDPDTFDIHRDNISHLTFGKGVHYCLGANLARLEGRVALDELLNRWPEWGIDYEQRACPRRRRPCGAGSGCASCCPEAGRTRRAARVSDGATRRLGDDPGMLAVDLLARVGLATLLGVAIGFERQWRSRMAGLQTMALVSMGSSLFLILSAYSFNQEVNRLTVAAQIVSGIGFLGAGVIMKQGCR